MEYVSVFAINNNRTRTYINKSVKVRVFTKDNKLTIVIADIIKAASVKYKALFVFTITSLA
jgi:hypothetical protein